MNNVILETEVLREKWENLITLKGITHIEVLKLSQKLDKYILILFSKKSTILHIPKDILINRKAGTLNETIKI